MLELILLFGAITLGGSLIVALNDTIERDPKLTIRLARALLTRAFRAPRMTRVNDARARARPGWGRRAATRSGGPT